MLLKHHLLTLSAAVLTALCMAGCGGKGGEAPNNPESVADSFSTSYFNWKFQNAMNYVDSTSQKWIIYAASNVHQADIDKLRAMEESAETEVNDVDYENDSSATVTVTVRNFLQMDTIGTSGHIVEEAKFHLSTIKKGEKWHVALTSLPSAVKNRK